MRFLLDEAMSPRLAGLLQVVGHDVVDARAVGLRSASDPVVLASAVEQDRILITLDTDFGALIAASGARSPSVILFRGRATRRPEAQAALLLGNLSQIEADLVAGAIVVIGNERLRVRRLPVE